MHRLNNPISSNDIVRAGFLNAIQEEVGNAIEHEGISLYPDHHSDSRTQLWNVIQSYVRHQPYDLVIDTQEKFYSLLCDRVGANQYRIKSTLRSVYIKSISGGYNCYGAPFLSGGDTWGYIQTNNCVNLVFENGAYFNAGDTPFYLEVNTDDCKLENVYIKGTGSSAADLKQSFLLNAYRVVYKNCKTSNRYTNNTDANGFIGFNGKGSLAYDITASYINCSVFNITAQCVNSSDLAIGFKNCYNLNNCLVYGIISTDASILGFSYCYNMSSCSTYLLEATNGDCMGFHYCKSLSSCYAYTLEGNTSAVSGVIGFYACYMLSACFADQIVGNAVAATGFASCFCFSACHAGTITSVGSTEAGFVFCRYGSALYTAEAANPSNDWMDSSDAQITNKYSVPAVFT